MLLMCGKHKPILQKNSHVYFDLPTSMAHPKPRPFHSFNLIYEHRCGITNSSYLLIKKWHFMVRFILSIKQRQLFNLSKSKYNLEAAFGRESG